MAEIEIAEPTDTPLEILRRYDIAGLINSRVINIFYQTGKVLQRVAFISPRGTQFIIEIWNSSAEMQPVFLKDWRQIQFLLVRNAIFHGITFLDSDKNKIIYVFRLGQQLALKTRFVWLSNDSKYFWDEPVTIRDEKTAEDSELEV